MRLAVGYFLPPKLKNVKEMFKKFYLMVVLGSAFACHAGTSKPAKVSGSTNLEPTAQQGIVCKTVAGIISQYNYKKVDLNDSLSIVIFNRYLKSLDEDHNYLAIRN